MSKKHFIALADALRRTKPIPPSEDEYGDGQENQWEQDVEEISAVCRQFNPQFNKERWLGYINGDNGPSGGTIKKENK